MEIIPETEKRTLMYSGPAKDIAVRIGHGKTGKPPRFMKEVTLASVMYS